MPGNPLRLSRPSLTGSASAGFTLLELLVVLVLAAITATVVGVGGQSYMDRARYLQVVRDVASQLKQARMLCIQDGKAVVVTYQPETRQLLVDGQLRVEFPPSVDVRWEAVDAGQKISQVPGLSIFEFNADGGARGGRLSVSRGGQGVVFLVNWLLGTVEQAPFLAAV